MEGRKQHRNFLFYVFFISPTGVLVVEFKIDISNCARYRNIRVAKNYKNM